MLSLSIGAVSIDLFEVCKQLVSQREQTVQQQILFDLRLPRIIQALTAGAGLSLAGYILQMVTRNPLADPYLFGVSAGASLGAVVVIALASSISLNLTFGALVGALISTFVVLYLAAGNLQQQTQKMVLAGVACAFLFSAISSFILYFATPQAAASVLFWSLGSFANADWLGVKISLISLLLIGFATIGLHRPLLALASGDHSAHSLGVDPSRIRLTMLALCSILTAVLVANCGGIGFVGLMIPHITKMLIKQQNSPILVMLLGGIFMIWVDTLARIAIVAQEIPVGIITAFIGSFFFLILLRRKG
ncbi:iron ABC transporter permease [Paraferrimonas sp. SM1919]|uniref:FecCD family ABC transporter permease n=1 Tax=Paraferrimonas sp. SM1919 TaxID=2662263 RepID=UPI001F09ADE6|nr:iron ABC transporter permease [Paraferrimonas sp. SM1919]